uniref:Uncharacterized protein n=1 Tax=Ditylenchus dipsaci TaxID=166011 RepID=A0A915D404_9BILA
MNALEIDCYKKIHLALLEPLIAPVRNTDNTDDDAECDICRMPSSTSSYQFVSEICQLSHLWKGQRLQVTLFYPDIPAKLLQSFATAQILVIQLNLASRAVYFSKNEWCDEWYVNEINERNKPLVRGISPFDYSQLQQCHQLIVIFNETTEVNIQEIVRYLNSNPLANDQHRKLYLLFNHSSHLDLDKLLQSLEQ